MAIRQRLRFNCMLKSDGEQKIAFDCHGSAAGATSVTFTTQVDALADLVLTINDPPAPAPVGDDVEYTISVRNRGSKAAKDISIVAHFSDGIEPMRVEGSEGSIEPGQVKFLTIKKLDPGKSIEVRVVAKAEQAGLHRFRTEVQSGDTILVSEEATRYLELVGQRVSRSSSSESDSTNR